MPGRDLELDQHDAEHHRDHRGHDHRQHGRRQARLAERREAERHAHVTDIAPRRRDALQAHPGEPAPHREPGRQHANEERRHHDQPEAGHQRRIEHRVDGRPRQGAEEQDRQGEKADKGVERGGCLTAQDSPFPGQVTGQDHPEDRESDVEDSLHARSSTKTLRI